MIIALVKNDPKTILKIHRGAAVVDVNVPGLWQVQNVGVGWSSPDGAYSLVEVAPFQTPAGQENVSDPDYSLDGTGNVVETFATQPIPQPVVPPPSTSVSSISFINLFTPAEQIAIATAAETDPQVALLMNKAAAANAVDLALPITRQGISYLVGKNLITQGRADAILAGTPV